MKVRRAVPADARGIAEVHVRSWQAGYRGLMPDELLDGLSVPDREEMWRQEICGSERPGAIWVAERHGSVVGFCAVAKPSRDEDAADRVAEVGAIYVDPAAWRSGAGRGLMAAALDDLRSDGWQEATLWVLRENQAALDFYAAHEFRPDGAEQRYERSGTTGIRLRRSLGT